MNSLTLFLQVLASKNSFVFSQCLSYSCGIQNLKAEGSNRDLQSEMNVQDSSIREIKTSNITIAVPASYKHLSSERHQELGITPAVASDERDGESKRSTSDFFHFGSPVAKTCISQARTPVHRKTPLTFHSPPVKTPERLLRKLKERRRKRENYAKLTPRTKQRTKERASSATHARRSLSLLPKLAVRVVDKFQKDIKTSPCYVCTCCNRLLYKKGVVGFTPRKRCKVPDDLKRCITGYISCKEKEWICHTCDRTINRGKTPAQAVCNGLEVCEVPPELATLSTLESRLLATRYPFMKLVALPRGRESGIKGSVVNVPVSALQVCNSLPHTPNSAGIVPLKLKRKMQYRSSVSHQNIRPGAVRDALGVLQNINPFYTNTEENLQWEADCRQEDENVWKGLTGGDSQGNVSNDTVQLSNENVPTSHNFDDDQGDNLLVESAGASSANAETDNQDDDPGEPMQDSISRLRGVEYDTCLQEADPALVDDQSFTMEKDVDQYL